MIAPTDSNEQLDKPEFANGKAAQKRTANFSEKFFQSKIYIRDEAVVYLLCIII